jgi:hypothetical protein
MNILAGAAAVGFAAALLGIASTSAAPLEGWWKNGAPASGPNMAWQGHFGVMQISTTDADGLVSNWSKPTNGATLNVQSETVRKTPIYVFIVFKGCRPDPQGHCNVTVDFDTFDPSGKPYDTKKDAPVWVGRPPTPRGNLQLSEGALAVRIEDKDPIGAYRVVATTTDHVAGVTLRTEQSLTVKDAQ